MSFMSKSFGDRKLGDLGLFGHFIVAVMFIGIFMIVIMTIYLVVDHVTNFTGFPDYYLISEDKNYGCEDYKENALRCWENRETHIDPDIESKTLDGDDYYCHINGKILVCAEIAFMNK